MKKLLKNKKFVTVSSIGLAFIMILSATFAWFTAQDSVTNKFKTGGIPTDTVKVWEIFKEPEEWKPGEKVQKDVGVANLGKEAVFVRASFKEAIDKLKADGNQLKVELEDSLQTTGFIPVPVNDMSTADGWALADVAGYSVDGLNADDKLYVKEITSDSKTEVLYSLVSSQNGAVQAAVEIKDKDIKISNVKYKYYTKASLVEGDWTTGTFVGENNTGISKIDPKVILSYHTDNMSAVGTPEKDKWFYNKEDGWFYFAGAVKGGAITPFFLNSVTLDPSADNTYQFLDYKLTVVSEGIQGTPEALSAWGITKDSNEALFNLMSEAVK